MVGIGWVICLGLPANATVVRLWRSRRSHIQASPQSNNGWIRSFSFRSGSSSSQRTSPCFVFLYLQSVSALAHFFFATKGCADYSILNRHHIIEPNNLSQQKAFCEEFYGEQWPRTQDLHAALSIQASILSYSHICIYFNITTYSGIEYNSIVSRYLYTI